MGMTGEWAERIIRRLTTYWTAELPVWRSW